MHWLSVDDNEDDNVDDNDDDDEHERGQPALINSDQR